MKVVPLAIIIGQACEAIPYINQAATPKVKMEYILTERPEVFFVLRIFIACGKNEIVVQKAAT